MVEWRCFVCSPDSRVNDKSGFATTVTQRMRKEHVDKLLIRMHRIFALITVKYSRMQDYF